MASKSNDYGMNGKREVEEAISEILAADPQSNHLSAPLYPKTHPLPFQSVIHAQVCTFSPAQMGISNPLKPYKFLFWSRQLCRQV